MSIAHLPGSEAPAAHGRASESTPAPGRSVPPLPRTATLSEIFAGNGRDAAAIGFALAQACSNKPLLWVQDRLSILEAGRPFAASIPNDFIHVEARDAKAALWAMEEGLKCSALGTVVGELWGDPKALDFTATRRLAVAAERSGVSATLILFSSEPNLSGARMRWRVASRPSPDHRWDAHAPGAPAWTLDLFKARGFAPGRWNVAHEADGFRLLPRMGDGVLAPSDERSAA